MFLRGLVLAAVASAALASGASAATSPALVGSVSNATSLSGSTAVAVSGNYAYSVAYWSGQLNVINISNPAAPAIVGSTPTTTSMIAATNVTVSGNYAFVTAKNRNGPCTPGPVPTCGLGSNDDGSGNSLTIVNISNPAAPSVTGALHDTTNLFGAYAVAVSGNFAYVASQGVLRGEPQTPLTSTGSFSVINITNPAGPALMGTIANGSANSLDHLTSVAISGNVAYVTAFYGQRLTAINIANPAAPTLISSLHDTANLVAPDDVIIRGSDAFVVNEVTSGLELTAVNISNPAAMTVAGTLSDTHLLGAYRVRTRGNFIYVSANSAASVAAIDVSNPSAPRLAGAVTDSTHLSNVTGLDVSSTGRYLVATSPRLKGDPLVTYPAYPTQGGPNVTGTVSVIDLEPSPLAVTIAPASEPRNPTSQTSASFSFAVSDAVTTVQCSLDHAPLGPCSSSTTATYSSLGLGNHTFTVQATDATGATARASYTWLIGTGTAPGNSAAPKITGMAQQGKKLTASTGTWSGTPAPTYSYQWQRCNSHGKSCKAISKQTASTYHVTAADVGSRLNVVVTASNLAGAIKATSAATKVVTWSSSSFATAALSHSKTSNPGLSLSISSPGSGLSLQKVVLALPKGLAFSGSAQALARGLGLKNLSRKSLQFKLSLKGGVLTITLKKPPTGVKLTLARGLVSTSSAFHQLTKAKAKGLKLAVSLYYKGKPRRRGSVKLRLA